MKRMLDVATLACFLRAVIDTATWGMSRKAIRFN